jgi:hypothetical protein
VLGQEDRRQERGVLDALDRVRFARGQVERLPGFKGLRLAEGGERHPPLQTTHDDLALGLMLLDSLPAGRTRRMTSTCSARTRAFVCAGASADPRGRTSTTSHGLACGVAVAVSSLTRPREEAYLGGASGPPLPGAAVALGQDIPRGAKTVPGPQPLSFT